MKIFLNTSDINKPKIEITENKRTLKDYTEYVNPNKVEVECSDGLKLTWESKNFPGGSRSKKYQLILFLLNNYDDTRAKSQVDRMLSLA